ncbi:MAG: monooxygenase [Polyangiaceae bacterium]
MARHLELGRRAPWLLLLAAAGCSDDDTHAPPPPTYYADVKPILDGRCADCHSEGNIGPFALTDYASALENKDGVADIVETREMPPWSAVPGNRDYKFDPTLTDEQIATVRAWADAGAPEGDPADEGEPLAPVSHPLSRVDRTVSMPLAYTPTLAPDEYRCFIIDWPETATTFITGFEAIPGNPKIDHHIAAYLVSPDNPLGQTAFDVLADLDTQDPEPGYKCFGGPAGDAGIPIPAQQIGQWVPGQGGGDFPDGTGIEVPAGSKVVLQMHYSLPNGNDQMASDMSQISFKVDSSVAHPAAFAPWLDAGWVAGGMEIPAHQKDVRHSKQDDPRNFFSDFIGSVDTTDGFRIYGVMLHMHKLGRGGTVTLIHEDKTEETLLAIEDWQFNWQRHYTFAEPVDFKPGDELRVECIWDNNTDKDVNWGEGTVDEMCVGNLYISAL